MGTTLDVESAGNAVFSAGGASSGLFKDMQPRGERLARQHG
jgi:hypothetical protein